MIFERKGCLKSYIYIYIYIYIYMIFSCNTYKNIVETKNKYKKKNRKTEAKLYSSPEPKEGSQFAGFFACH